MSAGAARLRSLVAPAVAEHGLYLEGVEVQRAGRRVTVLVTVDLPDGAGGVSSDALADVSRSVSTALDEDDSVSGAYVLEVSTPGAERPLREPRHYRRALGRLVRLRTRSGEHVTGRVLSADDHGVTLEGTAGQAPTRRLAYSEIASGRVEVELRGVADAADDSVDEDSVDEEVGS